MKASSLILKDVLKRLNEVATSANEGSDVAATVMKTHLFQTLELVGEVIDTGGEGW